MNMYLVSLTKPGVIQEDFLEVVACWLKTERNVLRELEVGREEKPACRKT